ncbi:hypothetical protein [Prosthecodimorpha hirschii]|uniref:hypothetical protein n=1 Tax=Prosthecodimorpha hirschii TaxID=665126 RepID=UPI00112990AB|nr:hypothetical protein [Prosthecomicrobium hirschii]
MIHHFVTHRSKVASALNYATDCGCVMAVRNFSENRSDVVFERRIIKEEEIVPGQHYFIGSPNWTVEFPEVVCRDTDAGRIFSISLFGGPFIELTQYLTLIDEMRHGDLRLQNRSMMATSTMLVPAPVEAVEIYKSMRRMLKRITGDIRNLL